MQRKAQEDWKAWSEIKQKMNEQTKLVESTESRGCYKKVLGQKGVVLFWPVKVSSITIWVKLKFPTRD